MINKSDIKEIVFKNYDVFLKEASNYSIKKYGLYSEDLVNEAIIGIIDCSKSFSQEQEVVSFVKTAIKNIYFNETENTKSKELNDSVIIKTNYVPAKLDDLYDLFYQIRFPVGLKCSKCGSDKIMNDRGRQSCLLCNTFISITNNTFLKNTKLSFTQIYKLATIISKSERINYKIFSSASGIKDITPLFKGRVQLIKNIMIKNGGDVVEILKVLLSTTDEKVKKVTMKTKFKRGSLFSMLNNQLNSINNLEFKIYDQSQSAKTGSA